MSKSKDNDKSGGVSVLQSTFHEGDMNVTSKDESNVQAVVSRNVSD